MMARKQTNLDILDILKNYLIENPDVRFNQALDNLHIIVHNDDYEHSIKDTYYEESYVTLSRITKEYK